MKTRLLFLGVAAALGLLAPRLAAADDLAIIVNKGCHVDNLTAADLAKYFKADKTKAPDGTKFVIVMHDQGRPERDAALREIFKMSEAEYANHFVEATFTGAVAAAPKALGSAAAVRKFVAETPGGLGYVFASEVDDSVKALKIDGKAPGEADYKLKSK